MKQYQIHAANASEMSSRLSDIKSTIGNINPESILIMLTWTIESSGEIGQTAANIENIFPDVVYYGCESFGNIQDGKLTYGISATFLVLEDKTSRAEFLWVEEGTELATLDDLWNLCRSREGLKAVEIIPSLPYVSLLNVDKNIPNLDKSICVFGGANFSLDLATNQPTVIAKGHPQSMFGMPVILYYGDKMEVNSTYVLGWKGLGSYMKVTSSTGKCIHSINDMPAFSIYEKYLNIAPADTDTLVFPLIVEEDGFEFIRTPFGILDDRSMLMLADIPAGTHARIAFGDKNTILNTLYSKAKEIADFKPQVIKAFSCGGRKMFWGDSEISKETLILEQLAPVSGFYTGGEIMQFGDRIRTLNHTLVLVNMRENTEDPEVKEIIAPKEDPDKSMVARLAYFVGVVSKEQDAAYEAAELANKSKSRFLFNMSHDIRTPMNAISGFTEMAKKNIGNIEKVSGYLDKIDIASRQLLTLINQVLEMSRIESGKVELDEHPMDINSNSQAIFTVLSEQARAKGLHFSHSLNDIIHNNVLLDAATVTQIMLNLGSNAIKYTPSGGHINISITEIPSFRDGYANFILKVADDGIGMSEDFQKILFEPFSREKSSTVSKIQGTGLGMSIVKSLVELMGGTIKISSSPGNGSVFEVTVPLKICDTAPVMPVEEQEIGSDIFKGRRVLLVEDNELNREIARFMLEENGFIVEEAENGSIAVDMVQSSVKKGEPHYYDVVLMDIQMPVMDGYEATGLLREYLIPRGVHIPIIALSANAFEEDKLKSNLAGMDDHIAKPIDGKQLLETLAKYL